MKLGALKINSTRAEQGDWISGIPELGDLRLKVRGFANSAYQAFVAKEVAGVSRDQREGGRRDGAIKQAVRDGISVRGMVEHILLDWEGLEGDDGKPLPYSKEQATQLLADPDFRPFRDGVAWAAGVVEEIETGKVEAVAGNSQSASGGTSGGARKRNT